MVGCMVLGLVLVVGLVAALATWVAASLLGFLAPSATPSAVTAVAVLIVLVLAILAGIRVFGSAVRPLGEIASATDRLADGEPGVRVRVRGPRPVRSLAASFNTMAERLDRSRDERRAMLADVTHELRTPITVVAGRSRGDAGRRPPLRRGPRRPAPRRDRRDGTPRWTTCGRCRSPTSGRSRSTASRRTWQAWRARPRQSRGRSPPRRVSDSRWRVTIAW